MSNQQKIRIFRIAIAISIISIIVFISLGLYGKFWGTSGFSSVFYCYKNKFDYTRYAVYLDDLNISFIDFKISYSLEYTGTIHPYGVTSRRDPSIPIKRKMVINFVYFYDVGNGNKILWSPFKSDNLLIVSIEKELSRLDLVKWSDAGVQPY